MENYSALTTVYSKDDPIAFKQSIDSMLCQSVVTNDYVIVADGPIPEKLSEVINRYKEKYSFIKFIQMSENKGLGTALNIGLAQCINELVARLDADDVSLKDRCQLQLKEFEKDSELVLVGSDMYEFEDNPENIISIKVMPHSYDEIYKSGKRKNPFNHSSVMYKKSKVLECGGYPTKRRSQDLELFSKILIKGYRCLNINKPLIKFRTGRSRIERKKKWADIRSVIKVFYNNYKAGYSSVFDFLYVLLKYVTFYYLPSWIDSFLFKRFYRTKFNGETTLSNDTLYNKDTRILYIWFGKIKNESGLKDNPVKLLNDREIQISNEYKINFKRNDKSIIFTIDKNENYNRIERNFYKNKDSNINIDLTCIVGKNGTGKTLILECIKEILDRKHNLSNLTKNLEYFILFENTNNYYKSSNNLKYICSENLKPNFDSLKPENSKFYTNIIFFNSTFNEHKEKTFDSNPSNIIDISSNYLLKKDYSDLFHKKIGVNLDLTKETKVDEFSNHRRIELKRKLSFYFCEFNRDFLSKKFLFVNNQDLKEKQNLGNLTRDYFVIKSYDLYKNIYKTKLENYLISLPDEYKNLNDYITESLSYIGSKLIEFSNSRKLKDKQKQDFFEWQLLDMLWILCLHYLTMNFDVITSKPNGSGYRIQNLYFSDNYSSAKDFLCNNLIKLKNSFPEGKTVNLDKIISYIEKFYNLIDEFYKYNDNRYVALMLNLNQEDEIKQNKLLEKIDYFIDIYYLLYFSLDNSDFLDFNFYPRFSSGEDKLMILLSRLYEVFKDFDSYIYEDENLILLLDEAELGYHPEWEKRYVYAILNYIQDLINYNINKRKIDSKLTNIQIILTTNSPMILSDILPQNVIQLDNDNVNSKCEKAFGANILDLYSEPFFINTGLIGRFAQEKINKVLKYVNGEEENELDYRFIINSIGDQNIRTFLQNIYSEKIRKEVR